MTLILFAFIFLLGEALVLLICYAFLFVWAFKQSSLAYLYFSPPCLQEYLLPILCRKWFCKTAPLVFCTLVFHGWCLGCWHSGVSHLALASIFHHLKLSIPILGVNHDCTWQFMVWSLSWCIESLLDVGSAAASAGFGNLFPLLHKMQKLHFPSILVLL